MKAQKNIPPNGKEAQAPAVQPPEQERLIGLYNTALIALDVLDELADDGNAKALESLERLAVSAEDVAVRLHDKRFLKEVMSDEY